MSTIAVDAMGGDSAPEEVVKGAILAKQEGIDVILSGDKNLILSYLGDEKIPIVDYPQVISMDEDPAKAIRTHKNSSILGALNLLNEKKVPRRDAVAAIAVAVCFLEAGALLDRGRQTSSGARAPAGNSRRPGVRHAGPRRVLVRWLPERLPLADVQDAARRVKR